MRRQQGMILMSLGAALILAALSLLLWNWRADWKAGKSSEEILAQMVRQMEDDGALDESGEMQMDGYSYIGYLSVPTLGLELPVMSDWSYSQLKLAPCRYSGSVRTEDLVIAAHNYSRHFGRLKELSAGDEVYFTCTDGAVIGYEVAQVEILSPDNTEDMTSGDYPLTLFTCTYGGQSRVTVRCAESSPSGT